MIDWSTKTIPNLLHDLDTDIDSLSSEEAAKRLIQNGKNRPVGKSFIGESFFIWCMNQLLWSYFTQGHFSFLLLLIFWQNQKNYL